MMNTVTLLRRYSNKATNGKLIWDDQSMPCVELAWNNNESKISCIPEGEYTCKYTLSPRLKVKTYEVLGVKDRAGIRIHPANYAYQLKGCIAIGLTEKDIDGDGVLDVTNSKIATEKFEKAMNYEDFILIIRKK